MRPALPALLLILLSACGSNDLCRAIPLGADASGLRGTAVGSSSDPVIRAMLAPVASAPYGRGTTLVWDRGPAEAAMCCGAQQAGVTLSWCSAEQLACAEPALQGVQLTVLRSPYSDESRVPDDATYCFIASRQNLVIAVWHRYWS